MSRHQAITLAVRVRPGASRTRVGGRYPGALGTALVVAVTARAVDGRATEAAMAAVADALGVRRSAVTLRSGATSRDKLLTIADPPADLSDRLAALLEPGRAGDARTTGRDGGGSA